MKISKLFHWLYGLVMLLPIFAIGTTCLISTFNMSSKQESEIKYKFDTIDVRYVDNTNGIVLSDFVEDYAYHIDTRGYVPFFNIFDFADSGYISLDFYNLDKFYCNDYSFNLDDLDINIENSNIFILNLFFNGSEVTLSFPNSETYIVTILAEDITDTTFYITGDFVLKFYNDLIFANYITGASYIPIDYVDTHNLDTLDIFYNSVDKVVESPLFNWAYNSNLLGVPVSYIGGIFGLASNSVINVLLCYWLAFSIIWLVFDVLMFVPLLIHKTLDKMRF